MRVGVRVRHLAIAREVGLIVCWVGEGSVYIFFEESIVLIDVRGPKVKGK